MEVRMKDFFKLLLGMIDIPPIMSLHQYDMVWMNQLYKRIDDSEEFFSDQTEQDILIVYGIQRQSQTDEQWEQLLLSLQTDAFKNTIIECLESFSISTELSFFMEFFFGVPCSMTDAFNAQKSKINISFLFEMQEDDQGQRIALCEITMPQLVYTFLDPCITALFDTYYDIITHYIAFSTTHPKTHFFHFINSCSPWLEEIFFLAFKEVFGEKESQCCRLSETYKVDDFPIPAVVLKSIVTDCGNIYLSNDKKYTDQSIVLEDSHDENVYLGYKRRLYSWRNRVGAFSSIPHEALATRYVYIDTCYGYSFDTTLFTKQQALYGLNEPRITTFEWIAKEYEHDFLRIPFYVVPRVHVKSASELFNLLVYMANMGCVFRGQTSEYYLNRSSDLMYKLYGDINAKEPSLLSYSVRINELFESHFAEWALLIKDFLMQTIGVEETNNEIGHYHVAHYYMFCLAVAQHYGLPTFGLDISYSLATALFFSMFQYQPIKEERGKCRYIRKEAGTSIIYLFKPKNTEMFHFSDFDSFNSKYAIFMRPMAQNASFAHASWGMAKNAIAERLSFAIQFDVRDIDLNELNCLLYNAGYPKLNVRSFFPSNDPFMNYLHDKLLLMNHLNENSQYHSLLEFKDYLQKYINQVE